MENNLIRSLSPLEAEVILALQWQEKATVTRSEIAELLRGSKARADKVIRSLRDKNWLQRLSGGHYLLIPAERGPIGIPDSNMLAVGQYLAKPYYFGFATAAAHYRFTAQSRSAVWIVTTKQLPERTIRSTTFRFVSVVSRKFFGFESTPVYEQKVQMSDREKTVIDCVDQPEFAGGIGELTRIIASAAPKVDWNKFTEYAAKFGSVSVVQRFGSLADRAKVQIPDDSRHVLQSLIKPNSRSFLASPKTWGKEGHYDREWQMIINVPEREILSEV
ncbi:MAG: type IV toxin-antitoxin system AbiEi family antitoxin [Pirellulales bacterium]